jgi:uncharacterized protein
MRLMLALIAIVSAIAAASPAPAAETRQSGNNNSHWIEVSGEGAVRAPPDFALATLGVTTTGKSAGEAMAANAKAANALVSLIKSEGIAPADIQTSNISISPVFSQSPRAEQNAPTITGYSVSNHLTVTVRDLTRLGALLDKAVAAGANSAYGVSFGHNDLSALLDRARPLALADARRKAEIYANAGGAKLGPLMTLTEEAGPQAPVAFASRAYIQAAAAPTPIEAGEDKLTVTVTARFALTPVNAP